MPSEWLVPTERLVKAEVLRHVGIVERLKEKHHISATKPYKISDVYKLTALSGLERKYNNCWARDSVSKGWKWDAQ